MRLSDFDYALPPDRIAQVPSPKRDDARLLVCDRRGQAATEHRHVRDLPTLLGPRALIVLNDTRVVRARLRARKPSGGAVELLVLDCDRPGRHHDCLARSSKPLRPGTRLELLSASGEAVGEGGLVLEREGEHAQVEFESDNLPEILARLGEVPLPPYILRERGAGPDSSDDERYRTIYARSPGAVAAPTAGLHFTADLLDSLRSRGHEIATLTLHVGPGTFAPVRSGDPREHTMHGERFSIPAATLEAVVRARATGTPIYGVGTTVVRALESVPSEIDGAAGLGVKDVSGSTTLFILPGHSLRIVDGLLTNFHLPRSTLLMLVSAFVGRERLLSLYGEALSSGYRFYSYGDAMLIRP